MLAAAALRLAASVVATAVLAFVLASRSIALACWLGAAWLTRFLWFAHFRAFRFNGAGIEALAEEGKVQLIYRPTAFLDANLGNDSSHRAVAAWGCAVDQGKTTEFRYEVFANQPLEEGVGYTDEQFNTFASSSGIAGAELETFSQCVADGKYLAWAANTNQEFATSQIGGTPSGFLNGEPIATEILADQIALADLVASKS